MDEFLLWRFQIEVNRQCKFALKALDDMALLQAEENEDFWYSMQAFLSAVANVSKLLWGSGSKPRERRDKAERRRVLRESLEVKDDSPLRDRRFRNHFDHFDERLEQYFEDWTEAGYPGGGSDTDIGPNEDHEFGPFGLRNFDTTSHTLHFRGEELPLAPLFVHVQMLEIRAVEAIRDFLVTKAIPVSEWDDEEVGPSSKDSDHP